MVNVMCSYGLGKKMVGKRTEFATLTTEQLIELEDKCKGYALQHANPFQLGKAAGIRELILSRVAEEDVLYDQQAGAV